MRIDSIRISVFETRGLSPPFQLVEETRGARRRWQRQPLGASREHLHVLHVRTDEGIEGVCTVGDARYRTMRTEDLEQLRALALGEDPFDRERLNEKCNAATRGMFTRQGWYGAFDNCLWDIAGKAAGLPAVALLGRARARCPCYLNIGGGRGPDAERIAMEDAGRAVEAGFPAVKDHFCDTAARNAALFGAVRKSVGPEIDVLHDAAPAGYTYDEALYVGRALEEHHYAWFEEPLPDVRQAELKIGLVNPPLPREGHIAPPDAPGWGAEWDWAHFYKVRMAEL